jgi:hypothetical protein
MKQNGKLKRKEGGTEKASKSKGYTASKITQ